MHPNKHWLKDPQERDSIAKAHVRLNDSITAHLDRVLGWQKLPGWRGWLARAMFPQASMISALHHITLWWGTYINKGALDEQISDRVRVEMRHVHLLTDETVLKLKALQEFCDKADAKLHAINEAAVLLDALNNIMWAVPDEYRMSHARAKAALAKALIA